MLVLDNFDAGAKAEERVVLLEGPLLDPVETHLLVEHIGVVLRVDRGDEDALRYWNSVQRFGKTNKCVIQLPLR